MNEQAISSDPKQRALALLIGAQALMTFLAGVNHMWPWTKTCLAAGEFVRCRELFSLSFVTPGSVVLLFLVIWTLERGRVDAARSLTLFVLAACLLGISMGVHEPMNALEHTEGRRLAGTVYFWDEIYGHTVFFIAYGAISLALIWSQIRNPLASPLSAGAALMFASCGMLAGAGIAFTEIPSACITADLFVMSLVIALAEVLRKGRPFALLPVNITLEGAYTGAGRAARENGCAKSSVTFPYP